MIDFTNLPVRNKTYAGANGSKISVLYNNELYMLKFPAIPAINKEMSYANGCISEYLGCHIFESIGIPVQKTMLGTYTKNEKQKCIVRSEQVAELCIKCYEDNVSGKLTDDMFMRFSQKYETERLELKEKIAAYRRRLTEAEEMQLGKEKFIAAVRKFMQMDRLTAPLLQELIDRIDVYEVTGTGKNRKQQIKIHYKFVGYLELPSLARQHNYREETRKGVAVEYVPNALPA